MSELANIISLAGQVLTIIAIILYITNRKKNQHAPSINKINNTHERQELERLTNELKQLEYVYQKGFIDDKEYEETKERTVRGIKELKGLT